MNRSISQRQLSLKPQDLVVLLKLAVNPGPPAPYQVLGRLLHISPSEVHASFRRAQLARLLQNADETGPSVVRRALLEFVIYGAKYSFPAVMGPPARGIPTSHAGPTLQKLIVQSDDAIPVWPHAAGTVRGISVYPLYPTVPHAALEDPNLYDVLTLFDAVRMGAARERELAADALMKTLA